MFFLHWFENCLNGPFQEFDLVLLKKLLSFFININLIINPSPMKNSNQKKVYVMFFLFLTLSAKLFSQSKETPGAHYSPNGYFDTIYDQYGKKYLLKDLQIPFSGNPSSTSQPGKPVSQGNTINAGPTTSCQAGYFRLFFGGGLTSTNPAPTSMRNILCQLYTDLSCFIRSPLSSPCNVTSNNTTFVNLYIEDNAASPALASFGSLYCFPTNPLSPNPGIAWTFMEKTIISGVDGYLNVATPIVNYTGANNFYHGIIAIDPNANWNFNTSTSIVPSAQRDFYTVMLHESMHGLGFVSLIGPNGSSNIGQANNYYSKFDTHLKDYLGTDLLSSSNSSCPTFNLSYNFNASVSSINGNTCPPTDLTNNCATAPRYFSTVDVKLYHPNCYEPGSSLSHFEDMCSPTVNPANNNQYFAMANAYGSVKRFPKPQERTVLCDLGYTVQANYSSPVAGANASYGGVCNGPGIWGVNDGLNGANYSFLPNISNGTGIAIPISTIINNDAPGTVGITCVSSVYSLGNIGLTVASGSVILQLPAGPQTTCGPMLLQYLPINAAGQTGNPTYIWAFFPCIGFCNPPDLCDMVQNGGFENLSGSTNVCGPILNNAINCWEIYIASPDLQSRNCQGLGAGSINDFPPSGISPLPDSWNGIPNNRTMGMIGVGGPAINPNNTTGECMKTALGAPLMPNSSYVVSLWAYKGLFNGTLGPSASTDNLVISLASAPNIAAFGGPAGFPAGLTTLVSFTLTPADNAVWKHLTATVTFTGSSNHNCLIIGNDVPLTISANPNGSNDPFYFYVDDISLVPSGQVPVITIPATLCYGSSLTNLAQYVNAPGVVFNGPGVVNSGGIYNFNTLSPPLAPGNYPITFNYTTSAGCVKSMISQITILNSFGITTTGPSIFCNNIFPSVQLSASNTLGYNVTYNWQPGNLNGQNISVNPIATTVYTVSAPDPNTGCIVSQTLSLNVSNNCCTQTTVSPYVALTSNAIPGGTNLSGQIVINQNTTLGPGIISLTNGEFVIAPGVILTAVPGTQFQIFGSHLYGCSTAMWQGIVIQNGAFLQSGSGGGNSTLIEDAIAAVDIDNITAQIANPVLELNGTIFNKNYTGIRVRNGSLTNLSLLVRSCIFTSRSLPFTSSSWPSSSTTAPGLRAAINSTTGLAAPYTMQNYPFSNLKSPYNSQPGNIGVEINNIGNISSPVVSNGIDFGANNISSWNTFNLFDGLGIGIDVTNASLITINNVFQNAKYFSTSSGMFGGLGIRHNITSLMNARLYLSPPAILPNTSIGNRFWDCWNAISTRNVFDITIQYAIFRSSHQALLNPPYGPGSMGIYLQSNRFNFNVNLNEFNNVTYALWTNVLSGSYNVNGSSGTGVYASNISVLQNYFGPEINSLTPIANEFLNEAIHINDNSNTTAWQVTGSAMIQSNKLNRIYRGISVNGLNAYPVNIISNLILVENDNIFAPSRQWGIQAVSSLGNLGVYSNTLAATGVNNQFITLVHSKNNYRSFIQCNDLSNSFHAFEFEGQNLLTTWSGNRMQNHARGLVLNNAVISPQGNSNLPSNNQWNGIWTVPTSYETYVMGGSNALSSPLFVQPGPGFNPTSNGSGGGTPYSVAGAINIAGGAPPLCKNFNSPAIPTQKNFLLDITDQALVQSSIEIFPNPTSGVISISGLNENMTLKVIDVAGKAVYVQNKLRIGSETIDLSMLANGIYFMAFENSDKKIIKKIVLAK
ncbi:hypothetical protein CNR22_03370 [Sphingobacteriaceae bacterium]|nr:hypothetical protein CNR22_03370 [Sphingobacteriaceae bacterium]